MITAAQREKAFRDDLAALIDKHCAEMRLVNNEIIITMPAWFENYEVTKEYIEFQL